MKKLKIAIFSFAGIGNSLLFLPMAKILREKLPNSRISVITNIKPIKDLLENKNYFDEIILLDKKNKFDFLKKIILKKFDITITPFPAGSNEAILGFISGADKRISHIYPRSKLNLLRNLKIPIEEIHDVQQNLNLLKPLGIDVPDLKDIKLELELSTKDLEFSNKYIKENKIIGEIVGIHPGSSGSESMISKRWSIEKFSELAIRLTKKGFIVLIFLGPNEIELEKSIKKSDKIKIIKDLSMRSSASLISKCDYFISNDSGLMHIATALDIPTLAIFGPTDPKRTGPWGRSLIITPKDFNPYLNTIKNLGKKYKDQNTMMSSVNSITVKEILEGFEELKRKFK